MLSPRRTGAAATPSDGFIMTAIALPQSTAPQWNWPRVGALSGAMSLHFAALVLLLIPPTAMTLLRPQRTEIVTARMIDPPKTIPEPQPPQPPRIVHEVRPKPVIVPKPTQVQTPVAESSMQSQLADPAPTPTIDAPPTAPADVAPTALAYNVRTRIPYPGDAAKMHQQGTVILRVLVGADGTVQTIEIEKSSGSRSLDTAARDAVRRWTFQAGTHSGIATALWARVPITFSLTTL
jgi:protein TonB